MNRTITIYLHEEEEKLLERLAKENNMSPESALSTALLIGARWDTYIYKKMADMLWQMQKCSYEESKQLIDNYKQKVNAEWEAFKASKQKSLEQAEEVEPEIEP